MKSHLCRISGVLGALAAVALGTPALAAAPPVSSNPDTDALRTGGSGAAIGTQLSGVTAQFSDIQRVFRACYAGGGIANDGSGCADGTNGRLQDFWVIQGVLRDSNTDPNGLGVPNGPSLGAVTYRIASNGASAGIACAADPNVATPTGVGFLAPEGFDGVPNTADDAGGSGVFGAPGPGINPNSTSMSAAPLSNCQGKTKLQTYESVSGTTNSFLTGVNAELCVVNYDLNGDGSVKNDQVGAGAPGSLTTVGGATGNETTNLKLSCDTALTAPPPADFVPAKTPMKSQQIFGAQIYKVVASRDVHAVVGTSDAKLSLNLPQLELLFGEPAGSSACSLNLLGAASSNTNNVTACIRASGAGDREVFRLSFMANTEGSKTQSEDTSGSANGTVTTCIETKEGGGSSQVAQKRVKTSNLPADQINCVDSFPGSFTYIDADRFDPGVYGVVLEGVDPDAAIQQGTGSQSLKELVKCGLYRFWGPLAGGVGARNPGGSAFITAYFSTLTKPVAFTSAVAYLPLPSIGLTKSVTDGTYSLSFVPTSCPGVPAAPIPISQSPTH